jgi:FkbM family methyltransferase
MGRIVSRLFNRCRRARRSVCEFAGLSRYSRPARADLDRKLEAYLPTKGFFIEAGAHDGFSDSNTYYLERIRYWRGVLVEPIPGNYAACARQRPNSRVFHAALVGPEYREATIPIRWGDRMSWVLGALDEAETVKREETVKRWLEPTTFDVPARTLASILDEVKASQIDFLSLDVEGYEPAALRGLDLTRYRPTWVLVECRTPRMREEVAGLLTGYHEVAELSHHDYLFRTNH